MSIQIKFRAWDSELKFFVDPLKYFIEGDGSVWFNNDIDGVDSLTEQTFKLDVMQYTGLKDKNGVEIYEGDIIWRHDCVDGGGCMGYDRVYFNAHTLSWGFIAWNNRFTPFHKWRVDGSNDGGGVVSSKVFELSKCKVIGNVHENPDLLKTE